MSNQRKGRKSLVWPLVLISLGILFLLNNLGIASWNIWSLLWRLWPVLVVAIGLDMILGRRSGIWPAITIVLIIALFGGAVWLFDLTTDVWGGDQVSETISHELGLVKEANLHIKMNVGTMVIGALPPESDQLISGQIEISEFEELTDNARFSGDTIYYTLSSEGQQYHPGWIFNQGVDENKNWALNLSPIPLMFLEVDTGVGRTEMDLTELSLSRLDVQSGVGEVTLYLPKDGNFQANVSAGVGKFEIYLPSSLAARIRIDSGLGNETVIGDFNQLNGSYISDHFSDSTNTVELFVESGVGNIRIEQIKN